MFTVTIHSFQHNPDVVLRDLKWKEANGIYFRSLKFNKKLLTVTVESDCVKGTFAQDLTFKEYKAINGWLTELAQHLNGEINDVDSQLGYLSDCTPAYIVNNWEKWEEFILTAKLGSLEGKKVMVLNEEEKLLAEGLLVDYAHNEASPTMIISSCTVITLFGERKISEENLKIEAVYE